jgi:hypothetical protein
MCSNAGKKENTTELTSGRKSRLRAIRVKSVWFIVVDG